MNLLCFHNNTSTPSKQVMCAAQQMTLNMLNEQVDHAFYFLSAVFRSFKAGIADANSSFYPLSPRDALNHHVASLNDLIS